MSRRVKDQFKTSLWEINKKGCPYIRLPKRVWIDERWSPKWGVTKIVILGDFHSITRVTRV